jgi:hypothetical protein
MFGGLVVKLTFLLVVTPAFVYLLAWICLRVLKSPRRVLVGLWILNIVAALLQHIEKLTVIAVVLVALLSPLIVAGQFGILWVAGSLWRLVGLSTLGNRFRDMATLHFRALRRARSEMI